MAGGLFALLDDVAALVKLSAASLDDVAAGASRASIKAAGVVVDDAAVTPKFVEGVDPKRELSIIKRIALGSLINKILIILPIILLLSQFLPWLLTPLLMVGGTYLCFEGAEKILEKLGWIKHHEEPKKKESKHGKKDEGDAEKKIVRSAITTDFVLSCEIMVIALNEIADEALLSRAIILVVVALGITVGVYGTVALIVKMDDIGLRMAKKDKPGTQKFGRFLVKAMPKLLAGLSVIGTFAMLWVGGHIILVGTDELGFHALYDFVHHLEEPVAAIAGVGGFLGWLVNTFFSLILGAIWGGIVAGIAIGFTALLKSGNKDDKDTTGQTNEEMPAKPHAEKDDAEAAADASSTADAPSSADHGAGSADHGAGPKPNYAPNPGKDSSGS